MNLLNHEFNPIQKQILAMAILHLKKSEENICYIKIKNDPLEYPIKNYKNLNEFSAIDALYDFKYGMVIFKDYILDKFNFEYSFIPNQETFTPYFIPARANKYVFDLYCEAEFIININLFEQWISDHNESFKNIVNTFQT